MKKEGYNLSMSEILNSIRSDIFADRTNNNYADYSVDDYSKNVEEVMSLSDNDNEIRQESDTQSDDDNDILELDDTFLESQDEQFDLSSRKNVVNGVSEVNTNATRNEKLKKNRKIDSKNSKLKKTVEDNSLDHQNDMSDEVDNFLKLIEENTDDLTFDKSEKDLSTESPNASAINNQQNNILTALNKANELIQQKSSENAASDNVTKNNVNIEKSSFNNRSEKTNSSNNNPIDRSENSTPSIMSESVKKESMKSIYKIIETQKKIQNEKRQTIDDLAMAALIPMLQDWMDKNLAKIVEKVVEKEIAKLINIDN